MAIPDYQTLMLPLLRRLGEMNAAVTVRSLAEAVADEFQLTAEERTERIPSGQDNLLVNRLQWARTYMVKAGLLASPRRGLVLITDRGRALLAENLTRIDNNVLSRFPEYRDWLAASKAQVATRRSSTPSGGAVLDNTSGDTALQVEQETPLERIGNAVAELEEALKAELLSQVREMTPSDFEGLIVKLLLAMGYGQGSEEMAEALGGTGDGGIDGLIHQDPLGLDRVYIQAKRYKEGNNVSSPDIRNFIGALNIHRASKGVFVTASAFTPDARQSALGSTVQVVLIDGRRLADLMLRYNVGVLVRSAIELKVLDEGFFTD